MIRHRFGLRLNCAVLASIVILLASRGLQAGNLEVTGSDATPAQLAAAGFPGLNGNGVVIGVEEAGNGQPNTGNALLPNGILVLGPQAAGQNPQVVTDHASEVTGVIVAIPASPGNNQGIAPSANIQSSGVFSGDAQMILNAQALGTTIYTTNINTGATANKPSARIINMSFGNNSIPANGLSVRSEFMDWYSQNSVLFVVAGNEDTKNQTRSVPSDSYNAINVGATGAINGAGNLIYSQGANYNSSNITLDTRTLTATDATQVTFGRIKTDIVAPGGDPSPLGPAVVLNAAVNNFPANANQFLSTSGQVWELQNNPNGSQGKAIYDIDNSTGGSLTNASYSVTDTVGNIATPYPATLTIAAANAAGSLIAPGNTVSTNTIAGTSFAAPAVSGAAALLQQYGAQRAAAGTSLGAGFSNEMVIKALLLNGASKTVGGVPLTDQFGQNWGAALDPLAAGALQNKLQFMPGLAGTTGKTYNTPDNVYLNEFGAVGGQRPMKIGYDPTLGTGELDVASSLRNYAAGQQDSGLVRPAGWDIDRLWGYTLNGPNTPSIRDYTFSTGAGQFSGTLTWNRMVTQNFGGLFWSAGNTFAATNASGNTTPTTGANPSGPNVPALDVFDLYLFQINGANETLIDYSNSDIDNIQHIYKYLAAGTYDLEVVAQTPNSFFPVSGDLYAVAWSVPEPASCLLLAVGLAGCAMVARRRGRR